jgi:hypothetical protein
MQGSERNRKSVTELNGRKVTYRYDELYRLKSEMVENDPQGNNGAVGYRYEGDGNRVARTANGVTVRYLVDTNNLTGYSQVVEELVSNSVSRQYSYGHDLISQRQLINNNWRTSFYGYDGQGSVRVLTNGSGVVTDTYADDAFGHLISQTGSTPNEYLYTGERGMMPMKCSMDICC